MARVGVEQMLIDLEAKLQWESEQRKYAITSSHSLRLAGGDEIA